MSAGTSRNEPNRVENAIERTRKYRTPVKPAPNPYEKLIPAVRPGPGLRGVSFQLKVNWFHIKIPSRQTLVDPNTNGVIYEAVVEREARMSNGRMAYKKVADRRTVASIVYKTIHQYPGVFINPWRVIFDDFEYIFTPDPLEMENERILFACDERNVKFRVTIKRHVKFYLNLAGGTDSYEFQWSAIFTNQNARFIPPELRDANEESIHTRFAHFGGAMYFIPKHTNTVTRKIVQPGVEAWLGFRMNVKLMEDKSPVIENAMTNSFFHSQNLNLLDLYLAILNYRGPVENLQPIVLTSESVMSPGGVIDLTEKLSGLKFKCEYVPAKDKDRVVVDSVMRHELRFVRARDSRECADNFFMDAYDRQGRIIRVRMDEWYYHRHGIILKCPKLPLCELKDRKETYFLPMELLTASGEVQKFKKTLDRWAELMLPKLLGRSPADHYKMTTQMISRKMEYDDDQFMAAMEFDLERQMIECPGRVLYKGSIILSKDDSGKETRQSINPETGEFPLPRAYETAAKEVVFVVCKVTQGIADDLIESFHRGLVKKCRERGMRISQTEEFWRVHDIASTIDEGRTFFERRGRQNSEIPVYLFFVGNNGDQYGEIKRAYHAQYGVVTQVIKDRTVIKMRSFEGDPASDYKSIFHNIWLQINAKLGGVNQAVDFTESIEPQLNRLPSHERTMFIGIDAIHPSPKSPIRSFTLATIVASIDRNATKYVDRVMVNRNCNETIQHFEHHFSALLLEYHTARGHLPDRVVVLRDGVSDSEMQVAASRELQSLRGAWRISTSGMKNSPLPPFTYIVVQKRHNTRFYRPDVLEKSANPHPATVVTEVAVSPYRFDFYMISHHTPEGTSRPIHYTVMENKSNFSTDDITEMCFRLSCLYAGCSKTISIPAPVKYADLRCEAAAIQFRQAVNDGDLYEIEEMRPNENDQTYRERVEQEAMKIEDYLNRDFNVPKRYPGMDFL